jgi:hypothetical protein
MPPFQRRNFIENSSISQEKYRNFFYIPERTYIFYNDVAVPRVHDGCFGPVDPCHILLMPVCLCKLFLW